jgi:hypothetical protein
MLKILTVIVLYSGGYMGRFAIIIGAIVVVFIVFVVLYVGSFYHGPNPDSLPPGILRGNISIAGMPDYPVPTGSLGVKNTDGWKFASPLFIVSDGDHYSYNMSMFPGHFLITLDNASYISQELPKKVTIASNEITVVDITLVPVTTK